MLAYHHSPPGKKKFKPRVSSIHEVARTEDFAQANNKNGEMVATQAEVAADFSLVIPDYVNLAWEYWLKTLYQLTGYWWLPPAPAPAFPIDSAVNSHETAKAKNSPPDISILKPDENQQTKKPLSEKTLNKAEILEYFDYAGSVYFGAARALLGRWESPLAEQSLTGMDGESPLAEQCPTNRVKVAEVLAFIIAWCHNPIFSGLIIQGENPARDAVEVHWRSNISRVGGWMMLSRQRCARELGMRPEAFIEVCTWLEKVGILETGDFSSGIISPASYEQFLLNLKAAAGQPEVKKYWPGRALQNKTTIYRLKVALPEEFVLPPFNPLATSQHFPVNVRLEEKSRAQPPPTDEIRRLWRESRISEGKELVGKGSEGTDEPGKVSGKRIGKGSEGTRKAERVGGKGVGKAFPQAASLQDAGKGSESSPKPFPDVKKEDLHDHGYVKYNVLKSELNKKGNHDEIHANFEGIEGKGIEERAVSLEPSVAAKLNFLKQEARFEGFSGAKGRITLDYGPALKLATNPAISLEDLKSVYRQVQGRWLKGELKNPVGYFYNSLKNLGLKTNTAQIKPSLLWEQASAPAPKNHEQNPVSAETYPTGPYSIQPVMGYGNNLGWEQIMPDRQVIAALWEKVRTEDLPGRFRLSSTQLKLLEGAELVVVKTGADDGNGEPGVVVKLRSAVELGGLSYEARNVIRMALTQRVGSGYALAFEIQI